ncbi:hypothetical protein HYT58_01765 [Candidatus Woesearchaeota archaeon]|nr:hypothetical protein [Candidatus Woesearchaeota archaeon]
MSYLDYLKFFKRGKPEEIIKLREIKKEISDTRKKLDELHALKEDWFDRKQRLKKKASKFVRKLKETQNKREEAEKKIREFLDERDRFNKEVKELILKIKDAAIRKNEAFKKFGVKYDPIQLKEQIKKLDYSIETEAFTFKKEKQVMDQIKELRKRLVESSEVEDLAEEERSFSNKIDEARKKADEAHANYKKTVEESRACLAEFSELIKKVTDIKKMQKEAFDEFIKNKDEFTTQSNILRSKLDELNKLSTIIKEKNLSSERDIRERDEKILDEKQQEVEEKLKSRKKLTTADLLAYQRRK